MGRKCCKCNRDNRFASVCMNGNIKAERSHPARPCAAEKAQNLSSSADSGAPSTRGTNECLYLRPDVSMPAHITEHVQLVDKWQIQKTAAVEIQFGSHVTRFVLDSGATCNIMCVSEYEKIKLKPRLMPSTIDIFTSEVRQLVGNMGNFVETFTYNKMSAQEDVYVLVGDIPAPCLLSNMRAQVMDFLAMMYHTTDRQNILKEFPTLLSFTGRYPSELVLGRTSRTHLPQLATKALTDHDHIAAQDREAKTKMKNYADARHLATGSSLRLEDWVLTQRQARKSDSPFSSQPLRITKIKGSVITAEAGTYSVTRNSSHFKEFSPLDDE
ncbi:hypothetical protein NDU88_007516 [Pleurodeles waltl]|uniref:Peptidase A2 domain-containing protein n=1 Tax=Pleurodeles waltl TaxID=8319 RepID=A0AAV7VPZ5_PLEWA|nr:hypothetical protein NDU88_007516 [Pleurodeles waltl]